jgi:hypothetical protein
MNSKKGVSDIVVTILLVLLALAAIAIVWGFISGQINTAAGSISKRQACLDLRIEPVSCYSSTDTIPQAIVRYKMNPSNGVNLTGLKVLIQDASGSVSPISVETAYIPKELQTITYPVGGVLFANAKKFSVAGEVIIDGKTVLCEETIKIDCR